MIESVRNCITSYNMINSGDELIAGISGGADSVCMFLQLMEYRKICDFDIRVVHINHLIRDDAGEDALFVKELCDRFGVEYHLFEENVEDIARQKGMSTEEAGRQVRYERFRQVMTSHRAKIAVAHNRNDVAETVLFNIFRGTGLEGLASLAPINGDIIRPLIYTSREEIEAYLEQMGQPYRTDSTNEGSDYARNRIRNVILPYAEQNITSGATSHIASLSQKMLMIREYLAKETLKAYETTVREAEGCADIDLEAFSGLDEVLKKELILLALERLTPHRKDITQRHVDSVLQLKDKSGEKRIDLPYGLEAVKQYGKITVRSRREMSYEGFEYEITAPCDFILPDGRKICARIFERDEHVDIPQKTYTKWFDYDKIINCVRIRNRRSGDYITINEGMDRKSLKDYLIDCKIPREDRDRVPVIADGSHILWIIGYRISEYYKVTDDTRTILEIDVSD